MPRLSPAEVFYRAKLLKELSSLCRLCPHKCLVNRLSGEMGRCRLGPYCILAAATSHFGEEPEISGKFGSGTLFFGACNLRCVYCQNYQISQGIRVRKRPPSKAEEIAKAALALQSEGCHNINWVTPSHVTPWATEALALAMEKGLTLPLVYNTSGYDSVEVLKLLEGIVDVYLTDLRYDDDEIAFKFSRARGYVGAARAAILEMARQVGTRNEIGPDGTIRRGLIVRILVLPNDLAGVRSSLEFLLEHLGKGVRISLMSQYFPTNRASHEPLLSRPLHYGEYYRAIEIAEGLGFENVLIQGLESRSFYCPDFESPSEPFPDARRFRRKAASLS